MKCLNELQVRRRNQLSFEHRFMTKMALTFISPLILLSVVMIVEIRSGTVRYLKPSVDLVDILIIFDNFLIVCVQIYHFLKPHSVERRN